MKRFIPLLLALTMLVPLAACGESGYKFDLEKDYTLNVPIIEQVKGTGLTESSTRNFENFVYDEQGRLVSWKETGKGSPGSYEREYDADGNIVRLTRTGGYPSVTTYEYNEAGQLIYENEVDSNNPSKFEAYTYTYNADGTLARKVRSTDYVPFDGSVWDYDYEFDKEGRVIKESQMFSSPDGDESLFVREYEYSDDRVHTTMTETTYEGTVMKSQYVATSTYDVYGHELRKEAKETYDSNGAADYTFTGKYEYDVGGYYTVSSDTHPDLKTTDQWVTFDEYLGMPTPDSTTSAVTAAGGREFDDTNIYLYVVPDNQDKANEIYCIYQAILSDVCGFTVERSDLGVCNIKSEGELIAQITLSWVEDTGHCLQVNMMKK